MPTTIPNVPTQFFNAINSCFGDHLVTTQVGNCGRGTVDFIWDAPEALDEVNRAIEAAGRRYAPVSTFTALRSLRNRLSAEVAAYNASHPRADDDGDAWGESLSGQ